MPKMKTRLTWTVGESLNSSPTTRQKRGIPSSTNRMSIFSKENLAQRLNYKAFTNKIFP
jgi:hypothetical protein